MSKANATTVDWAQIHHFGPQEFLGYSVPIEDLIQAPEPTSMLPLLDARLIPALDELRDRLGEELDVSYAAGAIARTWSPGSQHYCVGRLSEACDLFTPKATLRQVYEAVLATPALGAFGAYPQWSTAPGIHVDLRPRKPGGSIATWMAWYHQHVGSKGDRLEQLYAGLDWAAVDKMVEERG